MSICLCCAELCLVRAGTVAVDRRTTSVGMNVKCSGPCCKAELNETRTPLESWRSSEHWRLGWGQELGAALHETKFQSGECLIFLTQADLARKVSFLAHSVLLHIELLSTLPGATSGTQRRSVVLAFHLVHFSSSSWAGRRLFFRNVIQELLQTQLTFSDYSWG